MISAFGLYCSAQSTEQLDWAQIEHWAGSGPDCCALVVQFDSSDSACPEAAPSAYVWGYRWDSSKQQIDDNGFPLFSVETMVRAVAGASRDLDVLVQNTGSSGSVVAGVGLSYEHSVIDEIYYDFEAALNDDKVTFQWHGSDRPGNNTPLLVEKSLVEARSTHIIEHPLDAPRWGSPAYDYDHWGSPDLRDFLVDEVYWQSGWYDGYWAFWLGDANLRRLAYSGSGMSAVPLEAGLVAAWVFVPLDRSQSPDHAFVPAGSVSKPLDYVHYQFDNISVAEIEQADAPTVYYNMQGMPVHNPGRGIYIVKQNNNCKIIKL